MGEIGRVMNKLSWALLFAAVLLLGYAFGQTQTTQWYVEDIDTSRPCPNPVGTAWTVRICSTATGGLTISQNGGAAVPFGTGAAGPQGPSGPAGPAGAVGAPGASGICLAGQVVDGTLTIDATGTAHFKVQAPCH